MTPVSNQQLKTIVITGGGSGIGLEAGKMLLETRKYRLAIMGKEDAKSKEAVEALDPSQDLATFYPCDLRDTTQLRKTIEKITATHKSIYGLVNNAGIYPFGGLTNTTEKDWDETFDVNLKAAFLTIQHLVGHMKKSRDGARIVNVSSTAGILPITSPWRTPFPRRL